jgi:hypothetical protein
MHAERLLVAALPCPSHPDSAKTCMAIWPLVKRRRTQTVLRVRARACAAGKTPGRACQPHPNTPQSRGRRCRTAGAEFRVPHFRSRAPLLAVRGPAIPGSSQRVRTAIGMHMHISLACCTRLSASSVDAISGCAMRPNACRWILRASWKQRSA